MPCTRAARRASRSCACRAVAPPQFAPTLLCVEAAFSISELAPTMLGRRVAEHCSRTEARWATWMSPMATWMSPMARLCALAQTARSARPDGLRARAGTAARRFRRTRAPAARSEVLTPMLGAQSPGRSQATARPGKGKGGAWTFLSHTSCR